MRLSALCLILTLFSTAIFGQRVEERTPLDAVAANTETVYRINAAFRTSYVQVTGTFTATVTVEGSNDGVNYTVLKTLTAPGTAIVSVGWNFVKYKVSSYSSGNVTMKVVHSSASSTVSEDAIRDSILASVGADFLERDGGNTVTGNILPDTGNSRALGAKGTVFSRVHALQFVGDAPTLFSSSALAGNPGPDVTVRGGEGTSPGAQAGGDLLLKGGPGAGGGVKGDIHFDATNLVLDNATMNMGDFTNPLNKLFGTTVCTTNVNSVVTDITIQPFNEDQVGLATPIASHAGNATFVSGGDAQDGTGDANPFNGGNVEIYGGQGVNGGTIGSVLIYNPVNLPDQSPSSILETDANRNIVSAAKGTAYNKAFGTGAGTVTEGDKAVLLAGRAGGQTANGGIASSENLTLSSTANATKGNILFGTSSAYDEVNTRFGIGTTSIPHGGVGAARFAVDGTDASSVGPHVQFTTTADNHPVMQMLNWSHDNVSVNFDSYHDGAWKSSDAGSNFQIYKIGDLFNVRYSSGVAQGSEITWATGYSMTATGDSTVKNMTATEYVDIQSTALPACDATRRGQIRVTEGGAGVRDQVNICLKSDADAYAWRLITDGGP